MLCSNCSAPVRPVVAIDIDGTLGDYHKHLMEFACQWLGVWPWAGRVFSRYDGSEPFRDWFCEAFKVDLTTFRQIKLAYRQGGMKRLMPLFNGAQDLVDGLREDGVEVWLTTTRPWDRYDRVDPDTREWLRRHKIEFDGLLYNDNKMEELAECVDPRRVVAVLDDQPDVLADAIDRGWTPIHRLTPWNRHIDTTGRPVTSLPQALQAIRQEVANWRITNS